MRLCHSLVLMAKYSHAKNQENPRSISREYSRKTHHRHVQKDGQTRLIL